MPDANDIQGCGGTARGLVAPNPEGPRRASVIWATGGVVDQFPDARAELVMTPDACDLSELNSGRAPFLEQHYNDVSGVMGVTETAWIEGGIGWAIVRFSRRPRAVEIFDDIQDRILNNVSVGYRILAAEQLPPAADGRNAFRITRWRPTEISIVARGADPVARVNHASSSQDLAELLDAKRAELRAAEILRRRDALRADSWESWSLSASQALADELGADREHVARIHARLVREQLAALVGVGADG